MMSLFEIVLILLLDTSSVGQNLTVTAVHTITQLGALTVPGTSSFTTSGSTDSITLTNSNNHFVGAVALTNTGSGNDVSLTNNTDLLLDSSSISANLTLIAGGNISQIGAISANSGTTTLSLTAASKDILLDTQANDFGTSAIVFSGTQSNIRDVGIQNNDSGAVSPDFSGLTNLRNLTLIFTGNSIVLPALTLHNGGNLSVTAKGVSGGAITQSGSLIVPGTSSFTTTTGTSAQRSITLTDSGNQLTGAVALTTNGTGNVNLFNSIALLMTNSSLGSGTLTLSGTGIAQVASTSIIQSGAGAVTLAGNNGVIALSNSGNNFLGTISATNTAANSVSITDSSVLTLSNFTLTGASNLFLVGVGITQIAATTIDSGSGAISINGGGGALQFNTGILTTTNNTSSALQIANGTTVALGNINIGSGTMILGAGDISGAVTQNGSTSITVDTLIANTSNSLILANASNSINTLGAVTTAGNLSILSTGLLTINGNVSSGSNNISLTSVGLTQNANQVVNSGAGSLTIAAGTGTLTLNSGSLMLTTGVATLTADNFVFDTSATPAQVGGTSAGSGLAATVILQPTTAGRTIGIAGAAGLVSLLQGELNDIYASNVRIGNSSAGAITINTWTPAANFASNGVLTLDSAGAITQGGVINLSANSAGLLLRNASSTTLTANNVFSNIAANIAGAISISNAATYPLTVTSLTDDLGSVSGITAPGGVTLTSSGSGGSITVNQNITTTNNAMSLTGTGITLAASTTLNAGTNNITLNAGTGSLTTNSNSLLYSRGIVTLSADSMTLNGAQIGGSSTANQVATNVIVTESSAGTSIGIAGETGTLQLTATALDTIKATNVRIGDSNAGAIRISVWTPGATFAKNGVLTLDSGSSIIQTGAINLLATNPTSLLVRDATSVTLTTAGNNFANIAASVQVHYLLLMDQLIL